MRTAKEFDCVDMKRQVQERIRLKYADIPEREALRLQREAALADPVLGPFLAKVRSRSGVPFPRGANPR